MNEDRLIEKQLDAFDSRMDQQQQEYEIVTVCDICSSDICNGEEYYDFDGETVCINCIDDYVEEFKTIARG